jgi:transcriptional regulator with XRE-family HTH domain
MDKRTKDKKAYIQRVRQARLNTPYTQEEMAKKIGVDRPTYTNYEIRRAMPQRYIAKFCKAAGISADWLLRGIGPMDDLGPPEDAFFAEVEDLWSGFNAQNRMQALALLKDLLKAQKSPKTKKTFKAKVVAKSKPKPKK